jgi:ABC-2 type transport system permease protein
MHDKKYFNTSFRTSIFLTIALILALSIINIDKLTQIENFNAYFNIFIPLILSFMICVNSSTISSISIEMENLELLKTYPIKFRKILLAKFLTGFLFHLVFIIINALTITIFFRPTLFTIIMCYITPIIASIFSNLLYLLLDYKFHAKGEKSETNIINQRILSFIPPIVGIIIGFTQLFLPILNNYVVVVLTHTVVLFILIIVLFTYLIINNKKLYDNLTR